MNTLCICWSKFWFLKVYLEINLVSLKVPLGSFILLLQTDSATDLENGAFFHTRTRNSLGIMDFQTQKCCKRNKYLILNSTVLPSPFLIFAADFPAISSLAPRGQNTGLVPGHALCCQPGVWRPPRIWSSLGKKKKKKKALEDGL